MQEVTITLRFNRECLGVVRRPLPRGGVIYRLPRSSDGRVMFMPSKWRAAIQYAARVRGKHHEIVKHVDWDAFVDGATTEWRRTVSVAKNGKRERYALHEAFRPGDVLRVNAVLPTGLSIPDFSTLLTLVGTYRGISPFVDDEQNYGTFDVVSVAPAVRVYRESSDL